MRTSDNDRDSRPWLTMLHGFSQDSHLFSAQQHAFPDHRVFCPELLGHGARDVPTPEYSIASHAADVRAQMIARGIERTHFWGTHTGTAVGLFLTLEDPSLIASLVLEAPVVPGIEMPVVAMRLERARAMARTEGVEAAMEDWYQHAEWFRAIREDPLDRRAAEQREMVRRFPGQPLLASPAPSPSLTSRVGGIGCPALIYTGSEDIEDFKRVATWLADNLRQAERVELAGLGGFPAWESPGRVNSLVSGFLARP